MAKKEEVKPTETLISPPIEASKKHQEIFDEFQGKFQDLHKSMVASLDGIEERKKTLDDKIAETEALKASLKASKDNIASLEKAAIDKEKEANINLEKSKLLQASLDKKEADLKKKEADLKKTDESLGKQREELLDKEQKLKK